MRTVVAFTAAFVVSLVAGPALAAPAAFSGTIEMKITTDRGANGNIKMTIGEPGVLNELQMQAPQGVMNIKSLLKKDKPDMVYIINDAQKSYMELPAKGSAPQGGADDETWTIKKVGTDTVAGYSAVHVTGTSSRGNNVEMWTTKDVMDAAQYAKAMGAGRDNKLSGNMMEALQKEKADGFPVKMIAKAKEGGTTTMELIKVTKGALPATTFEVPTGYTKAQVGAAAAALPPNVQKELDEKLKAMTPEQREAMKKAMAGQH